MENAHRRSDAPLSPYPRMGFMVLGVDFFVTPDRVMSTLAAEERAWSDIGVVQAVGIIVGVLFLVLAIRAMFGGGKR